MIVIWAMSTTHEALSQMSTASNFCKMEFQLCLLHSYGSKTKLHVFTCVLDYIHATAKITRLFIIKVCDTKVRNNLYLLLHVTATSSEILILWE